MIKNNLGFTLIELLLVIAMISILLTASYGAFVQFNRAKDLNVAAGDFVNALNEAKSDTLSQVNVSTYCLSSQTFGGYLIAVYNGSSPNNYSLQAVCIDSEGGLHSTLVRTNTLPSSVSIVLNKVVAGVSTPISSVLFQASRSATLDLDYSVTLTGVNSSVKVIDVSSDGVISQE